MKIYDLQPIQTTIPLLISLVYSNALLPTLTGAPVGICYGRVANNLPPPSAVLNLIQSNNIQRIRIFDTNPEVLTSFSNSQIELMIGIPNEILPDIANNNIELSTQYLQNNIFNYINPNQIKYIAIGNEAFLKDPYYTPFIMPSINNLYQALQSLNLAQIKLSTPHAACILSNSFPPSNSSFNRDLLPFIVPLLKFLQDTDSPLMVNVYPFFSYTSDPQDIPLDYVLFKAESDNVVYDEGLMYDNMYDATIDSFVNAMEKEGFDGIRIMATETGWPKGGGYAAGVDNAFVYNSNVIRRSLSDVGTPKRPGVGVEAFLFGMFDEDEKKGEECERHFGIFQLDGAKAYDVNFVGVG